MTVRPRPEVVPGGTYSEWWWPENHQPFGGFHDMDCLMRVEDDPTPHASFFSHQFSMMGSTSPGERATTAGYIGIQTQGAHFGGHVAIFSIWDALAADGPGVARPFSGEGTGYQTMIPYPWSEGHTYRCRVSLLDREAHQQWWGGWVADLDQGTENLIGRIAVAASWGRLGTWSVCWTERYGAQKPTCDDYRRSACTFEVTADAGSQVPARHIPRVGDGDCPGRHVAQVITANKARQITFNPRAYSSDRPSSPPPARRRRWFRPGSGH